MGRLRDWYGKGVVFWVSKVKVSSYDNDSEANEVGLCAANFELLGRLRSLHPNFTASSLKVSSSEHLIKSLQVRG